MCTPAGLALSPISCVSWCPWEADDISASSWEQLTSAEGGPPACSSTSTAVVRRAALKPQALGPVPSCFLSDSCQSPLFGTCSPPGYSSGVSSGQGCFTA